MQFEHNMYFHFCSGLIGLLAGDMIGSLFLELLLKITAVLP